MMRPPVLPITLGELLGELLLAAVLLCLAVPIAFAEWLAGGRCTGGRAEA